MKQIEAIQIHYGMQQIEAIQVHYVKPVFIDQLYIARALVFLSQLSEYCATVANMVLTVLSFCSIHKFLLGRQFVMPWEHMTRYGQSKGEVQVFFKW